MEPVLNDSDDEVATELNAELEAGMLGLGSDEEDETQETVVADDATVDEACNLVKASGGSAKHARSNRVRFLERSSSEAAGSLGRLPVELLYNVLKFVAADDLACCSVACRLLHFIASDDVLWRRLYCLRWGSPPADKKMESYADQSTNWKLSYFERDRGDMHEFLSNSPTEFREIYAQMQAVKRSQAPAREQAQADDSAVLDPSLGEQITSWRRKHAFNDLTANSAEHWCSGRNCSYHQIGDVFLCEKTGRAHVCDETCREMVTDPDNDLLVCAVSGRCFDRWLNPGEEGDVEPGPQTADGNAGPEEQEFLMGSGRLGRAYLLGYNCEDEKELNAAIRDIIYST